jgi:hypothetical protein
MGRLMMAGFAEEPRSYRAFWPFYVGEHARAATRRLHFAGTTLALICLVAALLLRQWWLLVAMPVAAYLLAWIGHFAIERNRPATFRHPLWSLRADLEMYWLMLCGRMDREVARLAASPPKQP